MLLWRLVPEKWASPPYSPWDGAGARLRGGRWNSPGTAVVYLSQSLSLAALEILVHADVEDLPDRFAACAVEVPDSVQPERVRPERVSPEWRAESPPPALRAFCDAWVASGRSVLLELPSVIIPREHNFMLNPGHPDFARLKAQPNELFLFDPRLYLQP